MSKGLQSCSFINVYPGLLPPASVYVCQWRCSPQEYREISRSAPKKSVTVVAKEGPSQRRVFTTLRGYYFVDSAVGQISHFWVITPLVCM